MSKPAVVYPDAEVATRVDLTRLLQGEPCSVAIGKPADWGQASQAHVQVALDGTPVMLHPVAVRATVRVTVWAHDPTPAKDLAALAMGLLLAEPNVKPGTGLLPTRDPSSGAELATFTVRRTVRSQPIEPSGS